MPGASGERSILVIFVEQPLTWPFYFPKPISLETRTPPASGTLKTIPKTIGNVRFESLYQANKVVTQDQACVSR